MKSLGPERGVGSGLLRAKRSTIAVGRWLTVALLLTVSMTTAASQKSQQRGSNTFSPDIQQILELPEDKIDTGIAALTFAKEIYPSTDVAAYSARIDGLADEVRAFIARYGKYDPDSVIRAMNTYYYRTWGVHYDKSPNARGKQENFFITGILDSKIGQCYTVPMLYMAIAQRLGYPVYAVTAPEHNFLRFVDPTLKEQNIELSGTAGYSSDADYAYRLNISPEAIKNGAYLRTLTRRQYLGVLLQQNAIVFSTRGDVDRAILYFSKAYELDPQNVYFAKNLSSLWYRKAEQARSKAQREKYRENANRYHALAERLGWTSDPDANTRGK